MLAIAALSSVDASLDRIKSAMNVAGYCASNEAEAQWHAMHNSKEKCLALGGGNTEWISREHHHGSRRLAEMSPEDSSVFIVTMAAHATVTSSTTAAMEAEHGVDMSHHIPHEDGGFFFVHMTAETAANMASRGEVNDVTPYPDGWKVSPHLDEMIRKGIRSESTIAYYDRFNIMIPKGTLGTTEQAQELADKWLTELLAATGFTVSIKAEYEEMLVVTEVQSDELEAVVRFFAAQPESFWIEPAIKYSFSNDEAAIITQGGAGRAQPEKAIYWTAGIHGEGQVVGGADSGLDFNSCYFSDPTTPVQVRVQSLALSLLFFYSLFFITSYLLLQFLLFFYNLFSSFITSCLLFSSCNPGSEGRHFHRPHRA